MKILHINSYFSKSNFYKSLYDTQVKKNIDIKVYVPVPYNKSKKQDLGSYTIVSENHRNYDRFLYHVKHFKIYQDIIKKMAINEFSVIHAHSLFSNGNIALKLKKKFNVPYVVAVRNTDIYGFFKKMPHLRRVGINILKEANRIIFLSEPYKEFVMDKYVPNRLKKSFLSKSVVIPNGIDDFWYKNIGVPKKIGEERKLKLLHVGDVNKNKNIITSVKAIKILRDKGYDIKLNIVGKVKDQNVFNEVRDFSFVNYIGRKTREDLLEIYKENDIYIMPSINETFGLVYAEAMSQGLPVIYSKGQGFDRQFNSGEVGFSVDGLNPNEVSEKVFKILADYELISKRNLNLVTKFKWENIVEDYTKMYENII